jgi:hypothetical protein
MLVLRSDNRLVHVAPAPVLSRLEGLDDRVLGLEEVPARVPIRRGVAAAHVAAREAQAQMQPRVAAAEAVFTAFGTRNDSADRAQMRVRHLVSLGWLALRGD